MGCDGLCDNFFLVVLDFGEEQGCYYVVVALESAAYRVIFSSRNRPMVQLECFSWYGALLNRRDLKKQYEASFREVGLH